MGCLCLVPPMPQISKQFPRHLKFSGLIIYLNDQIVSKTPMQTTQSTTGLETATFRENHALDVSVKLMVDKKLVPSNVATPHLSKTHQVVHSKWNMITLLGRMANPQHHSSWSILDNPPPKKKEKTELGWLLYYEALFLAKDCSIKLSILVFFS